MTRNRTPQIVALALVLALLAAIAATGGSWKWGGTQREAGWTWNASAVQDGADFAPAGDDFAAVRDGWTWSASGA